VNVPFGAEGGDAGRASMEVDRGGEPMATVNEAIAALLIVVGWLVLTRALSRACRTAEPARRPLIENRRHGGHPTPRGPINPVEYPLGTNRLPLDQL
jgi:hypothetical protein